MMTTKVMNHSEYQAKLLTVEFHSLEYIIKDCTAVLEAWRDHPNQGYYTDEIHYCLAEIRYRKDPKNAPLWWRKAMKKLMTELVREEVA
jgi:hypothetical protein